MEDSDRDPSQEIMKKEPKGYRTATLEEKYQLLETGSSVFILQERVERIKNEVEVHRGNLNSSQKELEDTRAQHLAAIKANERVRSFLGISENDPKGVIIENGITYIRKDKLPAVTATIRDANGNETETKEA